MFQYSVNKLRVAYNDAFRQLLHEPRWCVVRLEFSHLIMFLHLLP